jgi:hypothetical protein
MLATLRTSRYRLRRILLAGLFVCASVVVQGHGAEHDSAATQDHLNACLICAAVSTTDLDVGGPLPSADACDRPVTRCIARTAAASFVTASSGYRPQVPRAPPR